MDRDRLVFDGELQALGGLAVSAVQFTRASVIEFDDDVAALDTASEFDFVGAPSDESPRSSTSSPSASLRSDSSGALPLAGFQIDGAAHASASLVAERMEWVVEPGGCVGDEPLLLSLDVEGFAVRHHRPVEAECDSGNETGGEDDEDEYATVSLSLPGSGSGDRRSRRRRRR